MSTNEYQGKSAIRYQLKLPFRLQEVCSCPCLPLLHCARSWLHGSCNYARYSQTLYYSSNFCLNPNFPNRCLPIPKCCVLVRVECSTWSSTATSAYVAPALAHSIHHPAGVDDDAWNEERGLSQTICYLSSESLMLKDVIIHCILLCNFRL